MKNKTFFFLLCLLFTVTSLSTVQAQFENKKYETESIYFKGSKYIKNGQAYPMGFGAKNLKKEMEISPTALIEFNKFEKNRNKALIFSTIGLATLVSSLIVDNQDVQTGLLIGGLGFTVVSFPFSIKASNNFEKAVWIRNGEILN